MPPKKPLKKPKPSSSKPTLPSTFSPKSILLKKINDLGNAVGQGKIANPSVITGIAHRSCDFPKISSNFDVVKVSLEKTGADSQPQVAFGRPTSVDRPDAEGRPNSPEKRQTLDSQAGASTEDSMQAPIPVIVNPSIPKTTAWKQQGPRPFFAPVSTNNWANHFSNNIKDSLKLKFIAPKVVNGKKVACPPPEYFERVNKKFENTLIGQFVERPPTLFQVRRMVDTVWAKFGKVGVRPAQYGSFLFDFENHEACTRVQEQLWHINQRPLLLRKWSPKAQLVSLESNKVPIWVTLLHVPHNFFDQEGLSYIASLVGEPLQMDTNTLSGSQMDTARICIEVNLEEDLPDSVWVSLGDDIEHEVKLKYAWKPRFCGACKLVGHTKDKCPSERTKEYVASVVTKTTAEIGEQKGNGSDPDEWMAVARKGNRPVSPPRHPQDNSKAIIVASPSSTPANRYDILDDSPDGVEREEGELQEADIERRESPSTPQNPSLDLQRKLDRFLGNKSLTVPGEGTLCYPASPDRVNLQGNLSPICVNVNRNVEC